MNDTDGTITVKVHAAIAEIPVDKVIEIAARGDVKRVEQADQAMTARELATPSTPGKSGETKQQKAGRIAGELQKALSAKAQRSAAAAAPVVSEGDRAQNADIARQQFGVTGVGVKACALSDGVDSLAPLPPPTMPVHPDVAITATLAARSLFDVPPSVVSMSAKVTP